MKRYIIIALTAVVLMSIVVEPVLGADGRQMGKGRASDMMEQGKGMRAGQGMHGLGFMHSAGNAYGEYVTFTIDSQTGAILNYGIAGTTLFNISIANFNYKSTSAQGSVTRITNTDGSTTIQLHDNPAAVINILTKNSISITFALADGATATKENNSVRIESGNVTGYIVGGNITSAVSGTQVKVDAPSNSAVVFRAAPVNMPAFGDMYRKFSQAIAKNRMGMEIALGRNGTYSAINYSERMQLRVQAMERARISLQVNATEPSGRIIAINLDNTSLIVGAGERLRIRYDNQTLQCTDDQDAVFNGTDRPLCWISPMQEGARAQLMLYVPRFSEHTIDILVEPETGTPAATITTTQAVITPKAPGFGLMVSLAGLLTWALLAKRRKNN